MTDNRKTVRTGFALEAGRKIVWWLACNFLGFLSLACSRRGSRLEPDTVAKSEGRYVKKKNDKKRANRTWTAVRTQYTPQQVSIFFPWLSFGFLVLSGDVH